MYNTNIRICAQEEMISVSRDTRNVNSIKNGYINRNITINIETRSKLYNKYR